MRFSDAQVGDKVYSRIYGEGKLTTILKEDWTYPVYVKFNDGGDRCYTLCGKQWVTEVEPTLFYIDGDNIYSETRPAPKLDWSRVPVDTKVLVREYNDEAWVCRYLDGVNEEDVLCWSDGRTSWSSEQCNYAWRYAKLAEPVTIDGITYPEGTEFEGDTK